ncbi:DUF4238 domain-containing protein [Nitrosomonas europaea]|uniref:DUF4238 domain-containing protein n=1 Tax=Nitrosomonas europaea TaxID=915 RepID=UPI0032645B91
MEKWRQVKVKHHYVWEYYLKNWAINNRIFWLTPKGKIAHDSPKGMCREDGFYKISVFDEIDIAYILEWSKKSPQLLQKEHKKRLEPFLKISTAIKLSKVSKIETDELKAYENILLFNTLENMYCGVESGAKAALDGLVIGDLSVFENKNISIGLYSYLGHQAMRTKTVKERFIERSLKMLPALKLRDEFIRLAEKNWWFICFMLGDNLGWSMYSSRHEEKPMLVKNTTDTPFITCDSPVVNIHPNNDKLPKGEPPEFFDLLFPVSPNYVLIIATSTRWNDLKNGASSEAVSELNARIAANARFSIYGNMKSVVEVNKKEVGGW